MSRSCLHWAVLRAYCCFLWSAAYRISPLATPIGRECAGNYSEYERNAQEKQQHMQRLQDGLNKKKAHMEKSVQVSHLDRDAAGDA